MKIKDYIFRLTRTKAVTNYLSDNPKFQLEFPEGWRQMRIRQPIAFYHEKTNSGLTIYIYDYNDTTIQVYSKMLRDEYTLDVNEMNFDELFSKETSSKKLLIDSNEMFQQRLLKLVSNPTKILDLTLSGFKRDKERNMELFLLWEQQILKCY